mgnify:CR=1 FL=1
MKKTEDKTKNKKGDEDKKDKLEEEESNTERKCKLAIQKLKSIFAYTKDYRTILEEYKKQNPNSHIMKKLWFFNFYNLNTYFFSLQHVWKYSMSKQWDFLRIFNFSILSLNFI